MVFVQCHGIWRAELCRIASIHDDQLFACVCVINMHLWSFFIFDDTVVNGLKICRVLLSTAVDTDVNDSTRM